MTDRTCSSCRHGGELPENPHGRECRRYPPQLMLLPAAPSIADPHAAAMTLTAMHPRVAITHHCGEHAPREVH